MHRGVVSCRVSATAQEVAKIMLDNHVSVLVVVDERFDAIRKLLSLGKDDAARSQQRQQDR